MERALVLVALLVLGVVPQERFPDGVVVEKVEPHGLGVVAGLRPGDLLLRWSRAPNGASDVGMPEQPVRAFDVGEIEYEHIPRGPVTFQVSRAGRPLTIVAPWESTALAIGVRPAFPPGLSEMYERGATLAVEGRLDEATAVWREVAESARRLEDGLDAACWMLARIGSRWAAKDLEASGRIYQEAALCAQTLGPRAVAAVLEQQGDTQSPLGGRQQQMDAFRGALKVRREGGLSPVAQASDLTNLGLFALGHGDPAQAIALLREAVSTLEATAPTSPRVALALTFMAHSAGSRGDLDDADACLARAFGIAQAVQAEGLTMALVLSGQAIIARKRGDFATASRVARQALDIDRRLAPENAKVAIAQLNLGDIARSRGDLDAAEEWYRSAFVLAERLGETYGIRPVLHGGLGAIAQDRGDLAGAESHLRQALEGYEAYRSGGYATVTALTHLGRIHLQRGDRAAARPLLERARALSETTFPAGSVTAWVLRAVGDLQREDGEADAAEASYERARRILERVAPFEGTLAEVLHGLGTLRRARGRTEEGATLLARAIEVLETQRGRVGATDEARSLFASRFYGVYHDYIDTLVSLGRSSEAFQVLETGRARALLTLMAERDLVLEDAAPPELERQRRRLDAEHEQARAEMKRLGGETDATRQDELAGKLRELREKQAAIMDRIRESSPRLAQFRDPQPLGAGQVRAALEPGMALLSYSVGAKGTVLFVLGPRHSGEESDRVEAVVIPFGSEELRPRIAAWRQMAEKTAPPPKFFAEARALYDLLIRPVEHRLASAERLVVCPDGPLHHLPFAALRRDGAYLAEWKPLTIVPSGTVLAQLAQSRPALTGAAQLFAFGDPRPPGASSLGGGRREVAAITSLFPGARAYFGDDATEARVKALGKEARYVHLAAHGLVNDHLPLESALAFTPTSSESGNENGLLHAWEIFERVRLDADLVTLSACRSAAGTELAGEGLIGLTRAFQYAGARSVLASLWRVPDKSTPALMRGFYTALKKGLPKDEALRRAQVTAIRAGHHPIRWATFQLYGDWR